MHDQVAHACGVRRAGWNMTSGTLKRSSSLACAELSVCAARRVTDDVIRSLFVAQELLHTKVVLLVHHTGGSACIVPPLLADFTHPNTNLLLNVVCGRRLRAPRASRAPRTMLCITGFGPLVQHSANNSMRQSGCACERRARKPLFGTMTSLWRTPRTTSAWTCRATRCLALVRLRTGSCALLYSSLCSHWHTSCCFSGHAIRCRHEPCVVPQATPWRGCMTGA